MSWPQPYPRIEHLSASSAVSRDDLVLGSTAAQTLLSDAVVVEEKLDGANVMLWQDDRGSVEVATRGGPGAIDRAGQIGPLRAWTARHRHALRTVLRDDRVLYAEWMWFEHSLRYARLPDYLIGLDVLERSGRWLDIEERGAALRTAGLASPPELWRGVAESPGALMKLLGVSRYGDDDAEGLIVRPIHQRDGVPRAAKIVRPSLRLRSNESWAREIRRNHLASSTPHAA